MTSQTPPISSQEAEALNRGTGSGLIAAQETSAASPANQPGPEALLQSAPESFDPYNTGSFRVLARGAPRRTLDDMRRLDAEIRRARKSSATRRGMGSR